MLKDGEGNGNPLQYSCLENPVDRGAWWAAVRGVTQTRTQLKRLSMDLFMHAMLKESQQWGLTVAPFPSITAPHRDRMNLEYKVKLFAFHLLQGRFKK